MSTYIYIYGLCGTEPRIRGHTMRLGENDVDKSNFQGEMDVQKSQLFWGGP